MNKNENKISALLKQNNLSESETVYLLSLVRKELEFLGAEQNEYLKLILFCDWALHDKLDRSRASNLVSEIHSIINYHKENTDTDKVICEVSKILLVPFRKQFKKFLLNRSLQSSLIEDSNKWKSLLRNVFEIIEQSRVILAQKDESIVQTDSLKEGMWVNEISIAKNDIGTFKGIYCLQMLTSDSTQIIIPLTP